MQANIAWLCARLLQLWHKRSGEKYLFPPTTLHEAAARLHDRGFENRSVRRGGLQLMALRGWSPAVILQFSRHRDEPMLMKYLAHGLVVTHTAVTMLAVQASTMVPKREDLATSQF